LEDLSIHAIGSTKALAEHLSNLIEQPELIDGPDVRSARSLIFNGSDHPLIEIAGTKPYPERNVD
jgi:hypothetical protein